MYKCSKRSRQLKNQVKLRGPSYLRMEITKLVYPTNVHASINVIVVLIFIYKGKQHLLQLIFDIKSSSMSQFFEAIERYTLKASIVRTLGIPFLP